MNENVVILAYSTASPIYQYVINLVVSLPIRRGPVVLMNDPLHLQWVTRRSFYKKESNTYSQLKIMKKYQHILKYGRFIKGQTD